MPYNLFQIYSTIKPHFSCKQHQQMAYVSLSLGKILLLFMGNWQLSLWQDAICIGRSHNISCFFFIINYFYLKLKFKRIKIVRAIVRLVFNFRVVYFGQAAKWAESLLFRYTTNFGSVKRSVEKHEKNGPINLV